MSLLGGTCLSLLVRLRRLLLLVLWGTPLPPGIVSVFQRVTISSVLLWSSGSPSRRNYIGRCHFARRREASLLQVAPVLLLLGCEIGPWSPISRAGGPLNPQTVGIRRGRAGPLCVAGPGLLEVRCLVAIGELFPHEFCCDREDLGDGVGGESWRRSQPYAWLSSEDAVVGIVEVQGGGKRKVVVFM